MFRYMSCIHHISKLKKKLVLQLQNLLFVSYDWSYYDSFLSCFWFVLFLCLVLLFDFCVVLFFFPYFFFNWLTSVSFYFSIHLFENYMLYVSSFSSYFRCLVVVVFFTLHLTQQNLKLISLPHSETIWRPKILQMWLLLLIS